MRRREHGGSGSNRRSWVRVAVGVLAVAGVTLWNALVTLGERDDGGIGGTDDAEPLVVEHERGWYDYLRGYHAHHGADGGPGPTSAVDAFLRGVSLWVRGRCLRGYTIGNHVYVCPHTPRIVRVHQAGHAPAFGGRFEPIAAAPRVDGGLPDEPLETFDVMLPGDLPHTFLRRSDRRGLGRTYREWLRDGRIRRVRE